MNVRRREPWCPNRGEALTVPADPGLTLIAPTVEPASKSAEALALLGSWVAQGNIVPASDHS
jgi:hypothetical protein